MPKQAKPNVLGIVSYRIFPALMGGQKCVNEFYSHIAAHSKVILAVVKENEITANNGMLVLPFLYTHQWGILNLRYLYKLKQIIKTHEIDIVFIEHSYFGWLGFLLQLITKKPFVIRSHNIESHRFRDLQKSWWKCYEWYEKRIHRKAHHSFFITQEDKNWATTNWQVPERNCSLATYGTNILNPITHSEKKIAREKILRQFKLSSNTKLFLFNGTLDYLPNLDALRIIIHEIIPELQNRLINYRIFICGNRLSSQWKDVLQEHPQIIFLGFVQNITEYLLGTDCLINPVTLGGGIKTKLIDALSNNLTCISSFCGASGIPDILTNGKLIKVIDYNWIGFADEMCELNIESKLDTPPAFYAHFNWNSIVDNALLSLQKS